MDLTLRTCPLCGQDNSRSPALNLAPPPWLLRQCAACRFVYVENPPAESALAADLAWEKSFAEEAERRRRDEPLVAALSDAAKKLRSRRNKFLALALRYLRPGPVLDVGCGEGHLLDGLPPAFIPFGIEVSPALAARARQRFTPRGGEVLNSGALAALAGWDGPAFRGAAMVSYLEHESRPRDALAATLRVLAAGARLIVKTPNYASLNRRLRGSRWCGFRWPEHVNYFTPPSLVRMVESAGLRVVRFRIFDRLPTSDNMWLVAEKPV